MVSSYSAFKTPCPLLAFWPMHVARRCPWSPRTRPSRRPVHYWRSGPCTSRVAVHGLLVLGLQDALSTIGVLAHARRASLSMVSSYSAFKTPCPLLAFWPMHVA